VVVCPTGIDIRVGLQMECIGCANCIDACDDIMFKIGQQSGLIRYDSLNGLEGKTRRILRPRVYLYTVLLGIGMTVFSIFAFQRQPFEANLLRLGGMPYRLENQQIINQYEIHLVNKEPATTVFEIVPLPIDQVLFTIPIREISLESLSDRRLPIFAEIPEAVMKKEFTVTIQVREKLRGRVVEKQIEFLGPTR
jgi:polyferredoxin